MSHQRQKNIAVTVREKNTLDRAKSKYEKKTGRRGDWGDFLNTVIPAGLAAMGIYILVKYNRQSPTVTCGNCGEQLTIAYSESIPRFGYTYCPHCGQDVVVDYGDEEEIV